MSTTLCDHGVLIDRECHACDKLIHDNVAARYFAAGAAAERARIVAWLRSENYHGKAGIDWRDPIGSAAEVIDAGAHEACSSCGSTTCGVTNADGSWLPPDDFDHTDPIDREEPSEGES